MRGHVFEIQRFCTHDGPGIRTTVFLKGCPLRCAWCHNPESQAAGPELFINPSLCIDCGACDAVCPDGSPRVLRGLAPKCAGCLRCADVCPAGGIERVGREMSVTEVLEELEKDSVFYETSGGGITLSGGEPLAQPEFVHRLLRLARERGLHTCVETSGADDCRNLLRVVPLVDLFLWDIKDTDAARLRLNTGAELDAILRNLEAVDAAGGRTLLRCILLPGINMDAAHLAAIAALYRRLRHCDGVELLPFHPFGASKHERLGRAVPPFIAQMEEPGEAAMIEIRAQLEREGVL